MLGNFFSYGFAWNISNENFLADNSVVNNLKLILLYFSESEATTFTAATPTYADLSHSITASTKLTVGGASTTSSRLGNSYSISGSGVDTSYTTAAGQSVSDGLGSLNVSSGVASAPAITVTQKTAGNSFTFSQSYNQGDAIPGSAVTTGTNPNFSDNVSSIAGGTAGDLAGTVHQPVRLH